MSSCQVVADVTILQRNGGLDASPANLPERLKEISASRSACRDETSAVVRPHAHWQFELITVLAFSHPHATYAANWRTSSINCHSVPPLVPDVDSAPESS